MGCGCQDKEKDAAIIEYYNTKKAMETENITSTELIEWDGNLCDFANFGINEEDITFIVRIDEYKWSATVKIKQS